MLRALGDPCEQERAANAHLHQDMPRRVGCGDCTDRSRKDVDDARRARAFERDAHVAGVDAAAQPAARRFRTPADMQRTVGEIELREVVGNVF